MNYVQLFETLLPILQSILAALNHAGSAAPVTAGMQPHVRAFAQHLKALEAAVSQHGGGPAPAPDHAAVMHQIQEQQAALYNAAMAKNAK